MTSLSLSFLPLFYDMMYAYTQSHTCTHEQTTVPPVNTSIILLTNKTIQRDADFELQCSSNVEHSPKFTWTFNETNLTNFATQFPNSRYKIDTDLDLGQLTVKGATYGDAGVYTCITTNRAGSDRADFTIDVEG